MSIDVDLLAAALSHRLQQHGWGVLLLITTAFPTAWKEGRNVKTDRNVTSGKVLDDVETGWSASTFAIGRIGVCGLANADGMESGCCARSHSQCLPQTLFITAIATTAIIFIRHVV